MSARKILLAVERWIFDEESMLLGVAKMLLVVCGILAICYAPFALLSGGPSEEDICLQSGRGWAIAGHHTTVQPMLVGKVTVMTPRRVTDYGCYEVRR